MHRPFHRRNKHNARRAFAEGEAKPFPSTFERDCFLMAREAANTQPKWLKLEREPEIALLPQQVCKSGSKLRDAVTHPDMRLTLLGRNYTVYVECKSDSTEKEPDYVLRMKMLYFFHQIEPVKIKTIEAMRKLLEDLKNAH